MKDTKDRIKFILKKRKISVTRLSKEYSVNQKTLNNQINGDTQITESTILLILSAFPEISAEWLLRGEGEMYREKSEKNNVSSNEKYVALLEKHLAMLEEENAELKKQVDVICNSINNTCDKLSKNTIREKAAMTKKDGSIFYGPKKLSAKDIAGMKKIYGR